MKTKILIVAMALLSLGALDRLSASLIVSVGQTGANGPVSVDSPRVWNFGITELGAAYFNENGLSFDSALFAAKIHKNTVEPLVFTLYSGLGGNVAGNTVLATVTVPSTEFATQYSGGGDTFSFSSLMLTTGYYSVTLTTAAPDKSTEDYFLKQSTLSVLNSDGTALDSSYWLQDQGTGNATSTFNGTGTLYNGASVALVPEVNAAWAMSVLGLLSFGGAFLRRFQKKPMPVTA
jgi:hypothetical protein